jgi:hypothetical protein
VATLVVVPIQESQGYGLGFGIPTAVMGLAILLLLLGAALKLYTYLPPEGSPLYRIWRVLAAAWRNRRLRLPISPEELYGGWGRRRGLSPLPWRRGSAGRQHGGRQKRPLAGARGSANGNRRGLSESPAA